MSHGYKRVIAATIAAGFVCAVLLTIAWYDNYAIYGYSRLSLHFFFGALPVVFSSGVSAFVLALWFVSEVSMSAGSRLVLSALLVLGALALHFLALQAQSSLESGSWGWRWVNAGRHLPLYLVAFSAGVCWLLLRHMARRT